jgi:hypothetical protein
MPKKESNLTLGVSEPDVVTEYLQNSTYSLLELANYIRQSILQIDSSIGEGIYWNAPTFFYTGELKPFNSKEYKRYIVGYNLFKQDCLRLVFLQGAIASDSGKILEGKYSDGRRIASFTSIEDFKAKENDFKEIIKEILEHIKREV